MSRYVSGVCTHMALLGMGLMLAFPADADTGNHRVLIKGGGGDYSLRTRTLTDMKFAGIVTRQKYDYSCGSAALATVLTRFYEMPLDEMEILEAMYKHGDKAKITKEGFSLLDMKNYLAAIGLKSAGYRESLDKLARVGIPAIVLINKKTYSHFVAVLGVSRESVLVGDPILGLQTVPRGTFESMWNGILFVIRDKMDVARQHFNSPEVWSARLHNRYADADQRNNLSNFMLSIAGSPGYY